MRRFILLVFLILFTLSPAAHASDLVLNNAPTQIYFSPDGGCTKAIVSAIDDAKSEILVQAYSSTSAPIAKAHLSAYKRGINVEAILDKSQRSERYKPATFHVNGEIPIYIDAKHATAHIKIMIIDKETSSPAHSISPRPLKREYRLIMIKRACRNFI